MNGNDVKTLSNALVALEARVRKLEYAMYFVAGALLASPILTAGLVRLLA